MNTFGERLTQARKDKGLSQKAFAELLEITATRLNYWEKDKREPDIPHLHKICEILNINGDWLLGRSEQKEKPTILNNELSKHEQAVIAAYREQPDTQKHIDKLLGVEPEKPFDVAEDIKKIIESTQVMAKTKNIKS